MGVDNLPRILQLAKIITASVNKIQEVLSSRGITSPSFDEDATYNLPIDVSNDQAAVLDATAELQDLLQAPLSLIHRHGGVSVYPCPQAKIRSLIVEAQQLDMSPSDCQVRYR